MKKFFSVLICLNILFLAACSSNAPVASNQPGTMSKEAVISVSQGTISSVKKVAIMGEASNWLCV